MEHVERKPSAPVLLRRSMGFLKAGNAWMGGALACLLAVSILSVAGPLTIKNLIDIGIGRGDSRLLLIFAFAFLAVEALRQGADFLQGVLLRRAVQGGVRAIRVALFRHLQTLSLSSPLGKSPGERACRITGDAAVMGESLTASLFGILRDVLVFSGMSVTLYILHPRFGLLSVVSALVFGIPAVGIRRKAQELSRRSREAVATANQVLEENLAGHRVIQHFALEEERARRFSVANDELVETAFSCLRMQTVFDASASVIAALALAFILWWGGLQVAEDTLSVGLFVAVVQYVPHLLGAVRGVAEKWVGLMSGLAAGERVFGVLDTPPAFQSPAHPARPRPSKGSLAVKDLRFGYREGEEVLKGVSLQIAPGESVALVGKTGAGKTTLARLLARLYDPWRGIVELGGSNLCLLSPLEVRRRIVFLTQEIFIFRATVLENVSLGDPGITREEVRDSCRRAGADLMIERLPRGYDTVLSEGGRDLSTGERQLLSCARILARKPEVVILDEPTAHLDLRTEDRLLQALDQVIKGRTSIIIAHRPSTLRHVDRIVKIDKGLIVKDIRPRSKVAGPI